MIRFEDVTIRDGLQQAGLNKSLAVKRKVLELLKEAKVDAVEVGMCSTKEDFIYLVKEFQHLGDAQKPVVLTRLKECDLEYNTDLHCLNSKLVTKLLVPVSDLHIAKKLHMNRSELEKKAVRCISYLEKKNMAVDICLEDATRADEEFILHFLDICDNFHIQNVTVADTVGCATPNEYGRLIKTIVEKKYKFELSVHCHNDLGLATANTIAGVQCGATKVECTLLGIGERAGNAAMEEVAYILSKKYGFGIPVPLSDLYKISQKAGEIVAYPISPTKPIVGSNIFVHEAGIHQDANMIDTNMYQFVDPNDFNVLQSNSISGISSRKVIKDRIMQISDQTDQIDEKVILYRTLSKVVDGIKLEDVELLFEAGIRGL